MDGYEITHLTVLNKSSLFSRHELKRFSIQ